MTRDEVADILATTAVIVNDLKEKRTKDYKFTWAHALHSTGNSGIKLQVGFFLSIIADIFNKAFYFFL
jgi:arginyl-tRNA synthetase